MDLISRPGRCGTIDGELGLVMEKARNPGSVVRHVAPVAAIAIVYFGAARLGLSLSFATDQVTAVWPPSAIAVAAFVLRGYRAEPGVFAGAFLINAVSDEPLLTAAGIAAGNTLEAMAALFLLRLVGFDGSLDRARNVVVFTGLAALVATIVGATLGVANLALTGIVSWSNYTSVWWIWWMGDAMGVLLVAPVILAWSARPLPRRRDRRLVELAALGLGLALVSHVIFSSRSDTRLDFELQYLVFPFLIWAALRFGTRETASLALLVSAIAVWGSVHGTGPYGTGPLDSRLILLVSFMAVTGVSALLLAAVTAERRQAQERLHRAHDDLEVRIGQRTDELAQTVGELHQVNQSLTQRTAELARRNEEVEGFVYVASHDLRAPLVTLLGFAAELERSCQQLARHLQGCELSAGVASAVRPIVEDEIPTALRHIGGGTAKFQRLIDALIALSRSGQQQYRSEEVDVQALVATAVDSLRPSIETCQASVSVDALPVAIGDPAAIARVFSNVIGNAVKYLEPGRPGRIEIGGVTENGAAHYWVRDNGCGIPRAAEPRLFQLFQRFHPSLAPGLGIGLAMVKRIVERLGGEVWVDSQAGSGTAFHLTLPAAASRREPLGGDRA
jgi:signal transduction histidine kinase